MIKRSVAITTVRAPGRSDGVLTIALATRCRTCSGQGFVPNKTVCPACDGRGIAVYMDGYDECFALVLAEALLELPARGSVRDNAQRLLIRLKKDVEDSQHDAYSARPFICEKCFRRAAADSGVCGACSGTLVARIFK